jgi:hypothetical protein
MALIIQYRRAAMTVSLSTHARVRMQQRGISSEALELLLDLGRTVRAPGGQHLVFIEHSRRKELGDRGKRIRERDRLKRLYAITDDQGAVVTVGHRFRRLARI